MIRVAKRMLLEEFCSIHNLDNLRPEVVWSIIVIQRRTGDQPYKGRSLEIPGYLKDKYTSTR